MKAKHTPGPWFTPPEGRNFPDAWWSVDARYASGKNIGIALISTSYADACLMAAAPDLLAACEKALAHLQALHPLTGDEDFGDIEQAIAKAKGEG